MNQIFLQEDCALRRLVRDADLRKRYREIVARGARPLILDCGANIGLASKYFAMEFPEAQVIAVEPDEGNIGMARINCEGERVAFVQGAIAGHDGTGEIVGRDLSNNGLRVSASTTGSLAMHSIPSLLASPEAQGCEPFIAKIDIEGFERDPFEADSAWIDRFPLLAIELHDWLIPRGGTSRPFLRQIAARDRDFVYFGENVFSVSNELC